MKRHIIKSTVLAGLLSLIASASCAQNSELVDITKPYLGEYECKRIQLGEEEFSQRFDYIKIELKADETFVLRYREKEGQDKKTTGTYAYDKEKQEITFASDTGAMLKRPFSLKNGKIIIHLPLGNKNILVEFEQ